MEPLKVSDYFIIIVFFVILILFINNFPNVYTYIYSTRRVCRYRGITIIIICLTHVFISNLVCILYLAGEDFTALDTRLTFTEREEQCVWLYPLLDTAGRENDETFTIEATGQSGDYSSAISFEVTVTVRNRGKSDYWKLFQSCHIATIAYK